MNQGFGAPPGPGGYPPQQAPNQWGPPQQSQSPGGLAIGSLVFGILSWVMFPVVAAIAGAIMGKIELGNIERGESPPAGKTLAQIGYWASMANIIVSLITMVGLCCLYAGFFGIFMGAAATQ